MKPINLYAIALDVLPSRQTVILECLCGTVSLRHIKREDKAL